MAHKIPAAMPSKKENSPLPLEKLAMYQKLIRTVAGVELKGTGVPYTSLNGHMFSYFEKDGSFGLRLAEKDREDFLKKFKTTLFISFGIVKKEFVLVPEKIFMDFKVFKTWFDKSFQYVQSLKTK
jgi:hypothetical protein